MEVHHHRDLHHKKKNVKEYFLEFLMIFLAVTMAFIGENMRRKVQMEAQQCVTRMFLTVDKPVFQFI